MDVEIDELCIRLLALHQPAARDLRLITTALKITTDLERIGDMAVNMCERALELNREPTAQAVHRHSADGRSRPGDAPPRASTPSCARTSTWRWTCAARTTTIDALNGQLFRELLSYMLEDPQTITRSIRLLFIAKYLERIADHATNIAEMVVFMVKGKSIRHLDQVPPSV